MAQRSQITRSDGEAAWIHDAARRARRQGAAVGHDAVPGPRTLPDRRRRRALHPPHAVRRRHRQGLPRLRQRDTCRPRRPSAPPSRPPRSRRTATRTAPAACSSRCAATSRTSRSGCNHKVACTIVVIPINGISCDKPTAPQPSDPPTPSGSSDPTASPTFAPSDATSRPPRRPPRRRATQSPGSRSPTPPAARAASSRPARATSPTRASTRRSRRRCGGRPPTGRNRFTIPITFGLPPDTCDVLDPRAPTGFYGSELLAQASLQWSPAYCLSKKRFKFQLNQMSDAAGWNLMESRRRRGRVRLLAAPADQRRPGRLSRRPRSPASRSATTSTGPTTRGEYTDLRLNPRLVAKLLTQSYLGSDLGRGHPGIGDNPLGDHERPRVHRRSTRGSARSRRRPAPACSRSRTTPTSSSSSPTGSPRRGRDGLHQRQGRPVGDEGQPELQEDRRCRARSGRCSTPSSRRPRTPAARPTRPSTSRQLAAPVTTLRKISDALLDALAERADPLRLRPGHQHLQAGPDRPAVVRRPLHARAWSASATPRATGCAPRRWRPRGHLRRPDDASLGAARDSSATSRRKPATPFVLDQADVRKSGKAYPGTMVVYTAAQAAEPDPGRRGQGRAVHPDRDHRGAEGGHRQRRAAGRVPADREDGLHRASCYDIGPGGRRRRRGADAASPPRSRPADGHRRAPTLPPSTGDPGVGDAPRRRRAHRRRRAPRRRRPRPPSRSRCPRPRRSAPTWGTGRCRCC